MFGTSSAGFSNAAPQLSETPKEVDRCTSIALILFHVLSIPPFVLPLILSSFFTTFLASPQLPHLTKPLFLVIFRFKISQLRIRHVGGVKAAWCIIWYIIVVVETANDKSGKHLNLILNTTKENNHGYLEDIYNSS